MSVWERWLGCRSTVSTLSLPVSFSFTQDFREAFRAAFVKVTGAVFVVFPVSPQKFPIDPGYPMFGYKPHGEEVSPTTLTWRFTIPLEVQLPEPVSHVKIEGEGGKLLLQGSLERPFVKIAGYPGVLLLNWVF